MTIENNEKIKDKINRYEIAYYDVLSRLMSKHEQLLELYPKGNKIIAVLGKNGIIVIHYPSSQDSFDFYLSGDMIQDIIPKMTHGRISLDKESVGFNFSLYNPQPYAEESWSWQKIEISDNLNDTRWSREYATILASRDYQTFIINYLNSLYPSFIILVSGKDDVKIWSQFFVMNDVNIETENIQIYGGRKGRGGFEKLIDNGKLIKRVSIPFMMIEDSDNIQKKKEDKLKEEGFSVDEYHILSEKEIENYLINPIAISALLGVDISHVESIIKTSNGNGKEKLNNIFRNLGLDRPDDQTKALLVRHLPKAPEEILQIISKVKRNIAKNKIR